MGKQAVENLVVEVTVNGKKHRAHVDARTTLADFLREDLELTGTKLGCEHGVCGACTVLINGVAGRSCLTLAVQADGQHVTTVEGLSDGRRLNALQQSFQEHHGLQCGFCTAGILTTATELLNSDEEVTEEKIREVLTGNICRCTGYETIVDAIRAVAIANGGDDE